jgi:hypothetical protein
MLKDGLVLLVVCVLLVGGTFWWSTQAPVRHLSVPAEQVLKQEAVAKTAVPVAKAPQHRSSRPPVVQQAAVVEPVPALAAPEPAPVIPPPPPFPAVDQIKTGSHEDAITGKYGEPALSAMTTAGGHMVETLIYARERGRFATVIRLEDGRVSAAYSPTEPVLPSGISAPRRSHTP